MSDSNEAGALPLTEEQQSSLPAMLAAEKTSPAPDADNPTWGVGAAVLVWIASLVLVVFAPLVFLLPYAASKGLNFADPNYVQALAEMALGDRTAVLLQVVSLLPSHLLTFALIWAVVTRFGKHSFWAAIGWGWSGRFRFWTCCALGVALFIVGTTLAWLLGSAKPTQLEQIINSSLAARYAISILAVGTAPFVEEFLYRGVLYAPLQKLAGAPVAVLLVLVLFTIIHVPQYWPNVGVIAAVALLSIALTIVRAYSRRLLPCVIIHLIFNGIQAVLLIAEPYANKIIPSSQPVNPTFILPFIHLIR